MHRILALEPDADRGVLLRQLVRKSLNTDLTVATSTDAAIALMRDRRPDLILTSMLLAANEEQDLVMHLRATSSLRHIPVLTIPAVADLSVTETRSRGLFSRILRRRTPQVSPAYNFDAVITRIEEAIEQSRIATAQEVERVVENVIAFQPLIENQSVGSFESALLARGSQKRARRWLLSELPWVSSVKLSWGQHLRLLNISSSGVLIESGMRLSPGSATKLQIDGAEGTLVVPARVIRCRVSEVDSLGVKYETAAVFDRPVDVLDAEEQNPVDAISHLDDLAASIRLRGARGAATVELRAAFETGVRDLITAGEVRLREVPVVENDGRESVYFTVPTLDGSPAVLQVMFNSNDAPGLEDFDVLTAAAQAASTILPLTGTAQQTTVRLERPIVANTLELQIA